MALKKAEIWGFGIFGFFAIHSNCFVKISEKNSFYNRQSIGSPFWIGNEFLASEDFLKTSFLSKFFRHLNAFNHYSLKNQ